jgi:hypothetical protein
MEGVRVATAQKSVSRATETARRLRVDLNRAPEESQREHDRRSTQRHTLIGNLE